jgi:hypothetical protein
MDEDDLSQQSTFQLEIRLNNAIKGGDTYLRLFAELDRRKKEEHQKKDNYDKRIEILIKVTLVIAFLTLIATIAQCLK